MKTTVLLIALGMAFNGAAAEPDDPSPLWPYNSNWTNRWPTNQPGSTNRVETNRPVPPMPIPSNPAPPWKPVPMPPVRPPDKPVPREPLAGTSRQSVNLNGIPSSSPGCEARADLDHPQCFITVTAPDRDLAMSHWVGSGNAALPIGQNC
ncbi:MAG: hypothetical protein HY301_06105 [Verrucomicrobia bacterium]|nr:hypothetical protein [Verrucomicrobiota bacterium]